MGLESRSSRKKLSEIRNRSDIDLEWIRKNEIGEGRLYNSTTSSNQKEINKELINDMKRILDSLPQDVDDEILNAAKSISRDFDVISEENQNYESQLGYEETQKEDSISNINNLENTAVDEREVINDDTFSPLEQNNSIINHNDLIDKQEQRIQYDNASLDETQHIINQLNEKIDQKYQFLLKEIKNIYNSIELEKEIKKFKFDLNELVNKKNDSLETLKEIDFSLEQLYSKFEKLSKKANELKIADDLRTKKRNALYNYQTELENKYGKYWFTKINVDETNQYVNLYSSLHNTKKEDVEEMIRSSIELAYKNNPHLQQEKAIQTNNTNSDEIQYIIKNLNEKVDKKHQFLLKEIGGIYNSIEIENEVKSFKLDLMHIMSIKEDSVEVLEKMDSYLDNMISKYARLSQKATELKEKDDFRLRQQEQWISKLVNYQRNLINQYGKYWFMKINEIEKEQYKEIYSKAYNKTPKEVEKLIMKNIELEYERNPQLRQEQLIENDSYESINELLKQYRDQGVENLKYIYAALDSTDLEQIEQFKYLFQTLSNLCKNQEIPKKEKLTKMQDVNLKIEEFKNQLQKEYATSFYR